jgi:G protein-coupled receptor Mth (Methuselah protein)
MYTLLVGVLLIGGCFSQKPCCPSGDNVLVNRTCADGSPLVALPCQYRYLTPKDQGISVDSEEHLHISTSRIPPDQYCVSRSNNTDVFVVCFSDEQNNEDNTVYFVNAVMELVSVVFLILTTVVYLQVPGLLDLQGVCILHSISGLAVSFVVLASNQLSPRALEEKICITLAYIIYFAMLYSFFWLNVLAFHIWRTIARPRFLKMHRYWPYIYYLFGCGGPVLLLIWLVIAHTMRHDINPGFGETKCWFKSTKTQFVYFYAPMGLLLCLNIIYYACTIAVLWRKLTNVDEKKSKVLKYRLLLCVKLFFIMGISWVFELVSAAFQDVNPTLQIFWYVTDGINTLQGILIFLVLVVFRKRVVRGLADRTICGIRLPSGWRAAADDECEEIEEELNLSETQPQKL